MMENLLFDPAFLILPDETANDETITSWMYALDAWAKAGENLPCHCYHLKEVILAHLSYQRFINFRTLQMLQQRYHLDIALQTIAAMIHTIVCEEDPSFQTMVEAAFLQHGLVVEPVQNTIVLHPQVLPDRWPEEIVSEVQSLFARLGVGKRKEETFSKTVAIVTISFPALTPELTVEGEALLLSEHNDETECVPFLSTFPLVFRPEDVLPSDIRLVWKQGASAITAAITRHFIQVWQSHGIQPLPFVLGAQFLASIQEREIDTNQIVLSRIIHAAAAVIAGKAMDVNYHVHPLHETKATQSPWRTRTSDGAKAWRLRITEKNTGWRMHYWHIPGPLGGSIEFSNTLKKHENEMIFE